MGGDERQEVVSWNREDHSDDTTLMAESEEELMNLLMTVKEESEKAGIKLNIEKTKIMTVTLITSWQIAMEIVTAFTFLGSQITAGGDCNHEIKRCLLLGRRNLDSIFYDKPRQHI